LINQISKVFHAGWNLLRLVAVVSSSIATILSGLLPLFLKSSFSSGYLFFILIFLSLSAILVHGVLTHLFNDYTDFLSGTDAYSPAILSGGSRVIQKGLIRPHVVWQLGKWIAIILLAIGVLLAVVGRYELTILIFIGVWAAASYSLPSIRLSYFPFLGEWLSLFPAMFFLGLAGPWIIAESIPMWAVQNSIINALICMGWVMIHHIPDLEADRRAIPIKRTSVVWFVDKFGLSYARFPGFLYVFMAGICMFWVGLERPWAALLSLSLILCALFLILKIDPKNIHQVTHYEKLLLLLAVMIAVTLGVL